MGNSKALERAGITAETENPPGGVIGKDEAGEPNGVLEEYAFFGALEPLPGNVGADGLQTFARAGSRMRARLGYTTAQEGRSSGVVVRPCAGGHDGDLPIDVVAFPDVLESRDFIASDASRTYPDRVRVGGCKLTIDGSPQGFTALRDRPYCDPVGDYPPGYVGYTAIDEARLTYGDPGNRPVLVHGQFLREDQVASLKRLGVFPSLFPMHTFYWAIGTATTRSGPHPRVDVMTVLEAMTIWPAWQYFEEGRKG